MKRIVGFLFVLLVLVFGLFFGLLNADPVTVNYYFGARELPLSFVLVVMLVVGAVAGALAGLGVVLKTRREVRRLRKELRVAEKELGNLRSLPLKEPR
jgi:lipopolysaccharide assembly protein A